MSKKLIETNHLAKTYFRAATRIEALVNATCTIRSGDRIALMGPSGSGKSTLLHLLARLDEPTGGNISWPLWGDAKNLLPEKVGFVFQSPSLLAALTVLENVEIPLLLLHQDQDDVRNRAYAVMESLELENLADKLPEELSGGQAQRVAVARALVSKPQLILADEPTGQLDHPTAKHLFDVLLAALEGSDTALMIATHDYTVSRRMNTLWQIKRGVLEV